MTTAADRSYTIGEVSERTGISTHTLRFYEKEGLFVEPIQRNAAGRRVFTEQEISWLRVGLKLRSTGMPLPDIRRYAELIRDGTGTVHERFEILRGHEARVRRQLADLHDVLSTIEAKIANYADRLAEGTADRIWVGAPEVLATRELHEVGRGQRQTTLDQSARHHQPQQAGAFKLKGTSQRNTA